MKIVLGYSVGHAEGMVALELEAAGGEDQIRTLQGEKQLFYLTALAAEELARALTNAAPASPKRVRPH